MLRGKRLLNSLRREERKVAWAQRRYHRACRNTAESIVSCHPELYEHVAAQCAGPHSGLGAVTPASEEAHGGTPSPDRVTPTARAEVAQPELQEGVPPTPTVVPVAAELEPSIAPTCVPVALEAGDAPCAEVPEADDEALVPADDAQAPEEVVLPEKTQARIQRLLKVKADETATYIGHARTYRRLHTQSLCEALPRVLATVRSVERERLGALQEAMRTMLRINKSLLLSSATRMDETLDVIDAVTRSPLVAHGLLLRPPPAPAFTEPSLGQLFPVGFPAGCVPHRPPTPALPTVTL